jgi:hypothetical protein
MPLLFSAFLCVFAVQLSFSLCLGGKNALGLLLPPQMRRSRNVELVVQLHP